jgi:hypothetical protein
MSSYNISDCKPEIGYIGAVDINCSQFGSTMYSVYYDPSISNLGNVLMFEYKLIKENVTVPEPDNFTLGFVSIENAVNGGISNQWTVAIPALNDSYNPDINVKIAIRVYVGVTGSAEVGVTQWSNQLDVHNPPQQPFISRSLYDAPSENKDDLYVFLQDNNVYDNSINFVVAYYYQDASGITVWDVSSPTEPIPISDPSNNELMIHVPEFGKVSIDPSYSKVYAAVYAVYTFKDASGNNYYTVSEVSNTSMALSTTLFNKPVITGINYAVYSGSATTPSNNSQIMTVNWTAPENSTIPVYTVDHYKVYSNIGDIDEEADWQYLSDVPKTQLHYDYNAINMSCNTTIHFRVNAISTYGTISPPSDNTLLSHINKFKYSTAPQNLEITLENLIINDEDETTKINLSFKFNNPESIGCGGDPKYFNVYVNGKVESTIVYNPNNNADYIVTFNDSDFPITGSVIVRLVIRDTNSTAEKEGDVAEVFYAASELLLNPIEYLVYSDKDTQTMKLLWNEQTKNDWFANRYEVYKSVNDSSFSLIHTTTGISYDYPVVESCNSKIEFYVVCYLTKDSETKVITSNTEQKSVFKYSQAPRNLITANSNAKYSNGIVTMDIVFSKPLNVGCGMADNFLIKINNVVAGYVNYNIASDDYIYKYSGETNQWGEITVCLQTFDTNSNQLMDGFPVSIPYFASALSLNKVNYQIYNEPFTSQIMSLSWNDNISQLVDCPWGLVSYYPGGRELASGNTHFSIIASTTGTTADYDLTNTSLQCNTNYEFRVTGHYVNGSTHVVYYSNLEYQKVFKFSEQPTELTVENTNYSIDGTIMNIKFKRPNFTGCGTPEYFVIKIGETIVGNVDYDMNNTGFYTFSYSGSAAQFGVVKVCLVTDDVNGNGLKDGFYASTPYVATDLKLNSVDYQVYYEPFTSQIMNLSWNSQEYGNWEASYKVYYKVNNGSWTFADTTSDTNYAFDASGVAFCNDTITFKVESTLTNDSVQYIAQSTNVVSKNIFKYSQQPEELVIENAIFNSDLVTMDIKFKRPIETGCGDGLYFDVVVNETTISNAVNYDPSNNSFYTYKYSGNTSQSGIVTVYLKTRDTNSPFGERSGFSVSTPYFATNLELQNINYKVYSTGTQDMELLWSPQTQNNWSSQFTVFYKLSNDIWKEGATTVATSIIFNALDANPDCGDTLHFKIKVTLTNTLYNTVYITESNIKSIKYFRVSSAPSFNVAWNSADITNNVMDMKLEVYNPSDIGCGNGQYIVINVMNPSSGSIGSKQIVYNPSVQKYIVDFNNLPYFLNGSIEMNMVTKDINSESFINGTSVVGSYNADELPIITDLSITEDNTLLSFKVITHSLLTQQCGFAYYNGSGITTTNWSTTTSGLNLQIALETLEIGVYQYTISMNPLAVGITGQFPLYCLVLVSNSMGITLGNVPVPSPIFQ